MEAYEQNSLSLTVSYSNMFSTDSVQPIFAFTESTVIYLIKNYSTVQSENLWKIVKPMLDSFCTLETSVSNPSFKTLYLWQKLLQTILQYSTNEVISDQIVLILSSYPSKIWDLVPSKNMTQYVSDVIGVFKLCFEQVQNPIVFAHLVQNVCDFLRVNSQKPKVECFVPKEYQEYVNLVLDSNNKIMQDPNSDEIF